MPKQSPGKRASTTRRSEGSRPQASRAKAVGAGPTRRAKPVGSKSAPARKPSLLRSVATAVRGTVAGAVAVVGRTVSRKSSPDAITLLEKDHRRMEDLLKRGESTTPGAVKRRRALLDTVTSELAVHELIEEKVFYPALRSHVEARDIVLEGLEEHHAANLVVEELHEVAADNEKWGAKFKVLQETIQHHIDEEEGEMFRTARGVLGAGELASMGKKMAAMKAHAHRE